MIDGLCGCNNGVTTFDEEYKAMFVNAPPSVDFDADQREESYFYILASIKIKFEMIDPNKHTV